MNFGKNKNIFKSISHMSIKKLFSFIKNPFKKQQNIEEEKPITFQEIWDIFFETLLSITPTGIAIIWWLILWTGIFLQYSIISQFLWTNIQGLYLVNIETAILYSFSVKI